MEAQQQHVRIESFPVDVPITDKISIQGDLSIPINYAGRELPAGIVCFAHGSGSGRFSPRNRAVAQYLNQGGLATLLVDLLTPEEEKIDNVDRSLRFNIPMLVHRLVKASQWLRSDGTQFRSNILNRNIGTNQMKIGMFGASTGGGAALIAAVESKGVIDGPVVSRGGRVDLAEDYLRQVRNPCLFIVGGDDYVVVRMNRDAFKQLDNVAAEDKKLEIVPGATHLFEEYGKMEIVSRLARDFFTKYMM